MAIKIFILQLTCLNFGVEIWKTVVDLILIAGMSLLGIMIFLLVKAKTRFSQKLLIVFFANAFFFLLYYYGYLHQFILVRGIALLFGNGVGFLLGPVLYFYLKSIVLPESKIVKPLLKSLIPYLLIWLFVSGPLSITLVFNTLHDFHKLYSKYKIIVYILEDIYFFCYLVLSLKFLKNLQKVYQENYSSSNANDLIWCRNLIFGFMFVIAVDIMFSFYQGFFAPLLWKIDIIVSCTMMLMYSYLGYKVIFQSQILIPDFLIAKLDNYDSTPNPVPKDEDVNMQSLDKNNINPLAFTTEQVEVLKDKVIKLLEEEKIHLSENLSLGEMAFQVGVTDKKLSELLNKHLNTNFYNLVNEYRVGEVKKRLCDESSSKYTLLAIAFESGFQSKASFNRIFKQKTGLSPAEYRKTVISKQPM